MPHPKKDTRQYPITLTPAQVNSLRNAADSMGYTYGGRGSVSLLIQAWADFLSQRVDNQS